MMMMMMMMISMMIMMMMKIYMINVYESYDEQIKLAVQNGLQSRQTSAST